MIRAVGDERTRLSSRAALASVALALILLLAKGWAALATHSTAMLGSLADTSLDLVASLVTLAGIRIAAMPADEIQTMLERRGVRRGAEGCATALSV